MTVKELHRLVRMLSNGCFVRWWAWYNYPHSPRQIGLAAIEWSGKNAEIDTSGLPSGYDIITSTDQDCNTNGTKIYLWEIDGE